MPSLKEIIKAEPESLVARAYAFAKVAHAGQKRKTGEPYFNHPLATAEILKIWQMDEQTIAAGLLHDTVEDTPATLEELEKNFGKEVAFLVDGVTKLGKIKYRGSENQAENLRKLVLKLSQDLRVVFIKLADRLHNMRTLSALPPLKQKRIALETDEIYAPLAYRLGMQNVSGELQDLAFPYLHPREAEWLKETVSARYEERIKYLERVKPSVEKALSEHNIPPVAIDFRAKRYSSLYKKLVRHNMDIDKIYDLVAFRIIVDTTEQCYAALGIIHQLWPPLPGRIKDFIAMPKPNGYRSLHTTVIGPDKKIIEFQIRTKEMHMENETGIAAHWLYKQGKQASGTKAAQEIAWVQQLRKWQENFTSDPEEFMASMKVEFFKDRIFVMTPRGDVIDLPQGATPVDFAYQIHTEVGNSCTGAKVNDSFVPLYHELHSGDMVEILTQKNKKPSEDWLKFAKTSSAREHIRNALNKSARAEHPPTKTELRIILQNRVGLIKDISTIIARSHVNIGSIDMQNQGGGNYPIMKIQLNLNNKEKTEKLILKLKGIREVKEISSRLI
jgi:GTP pyrophosphokinase